MDVFEVIRNRKSVRAYQDKEVEPEKLKTIVEAGNMAAGTPTAGPRHFTVITNKELIRRISETAKGMLRQSPVERARQVGNNPAYDPTFHAPALIAVSVKADLPPMLATIAAENAAAAGENMLLAATALGLGSCYVGAPAMAFADPAISKAAQMPEGMTTVCTILIGYGTSNTPHAPRPENSENIHYVK